MRFYPAGNFPQLQDIKSEKKMLDYIQNQGKEYKRLISFFYKKEAEVVLTLIKLEEDKKQTKLIKRRYLCK